MDPPAPGLVGFPDPVGPIDDRRRGKVRSRDDFEQPADVDIGAIDERQTAANYLAEVVGRNIGCHAHGDAARSVDQEVRDARRKDRGFGLGAVVVGREIDGLLVDIGEQLVGDAGHPHLGVTHGGRRVAVHGTEVALPVDQHVAQGEGLRHAHDGVIDGDIPVGMVFTDDITDHARRFLVRLVPVVAELPHRVEDAPVDGFQAVPRVRQRPAHDYAHRVIHVRLAHLVFDIDRRDFLGELNHQILFTAGLTSAAKCYHNPGRDTEVSDF